MRDYTFLQQPNEYVPFPEICHGAQFHVYDLYNGRVLKIPLTESETRQVAKGRHNVVADDAVIDQKAKLDARVQTFINGKARIPAMIGHSLNDPQPFLELLGNPEIIPTEGILPDDTPEKRWGAGRVLYTQDKVLMTHDILARMNSQEITPKDIEYLREIIDFYIKAIHEMWSFGYAEYAFKLGDTGFNTDGQLIFADLGECTNDLHFIRRSISQERWKNNLDSSKADFPQLPKEVHDYFTSRMKEELNLKKLDSLWRSKHNCQTCGSQSDNVIRQFITAKVYEIDYIDRW